MCYFDCILPNNANINQKVSDKIASQAILSVAASHKLNRDTSNNGSGFLPLWRPGLEPIKMSCLTEICNVKVLEYS